MKLNYRCLKELCVTSEQRKNWYLTISPEEYDDLYPDMQDVKYLFYTEPHSDQDLVANYLPVKLWRMNNLYWISDKDGNRIRMLMNRGQHKVKSAQRRHPRIIILKSRQQGISTYWLLDYFDDGLFVDNLNIGMLAQGLEEASTLLERVKTAWDMLDPNIKEFLGIRVVKDNSKEYSFNNDSTIFIRTSFRSATLQRLHVSELGKISAKDPQKAKELMAGTMQAIKAGNPVVLESTAEGRKNMFFKQWYKATDFVGQRSPKDFYPVFLSWVDDPDCVINVPQKISTEDQSYINKVERDLDIKLTDQQKWWVVVQRRESGEDFDQEYPYNPEAAFAAVRDGAYYARLWTKYGRVTDYDLYEPDLDVYCAMDLGMNDTMVLIFWQEYYNVEGKLEIRVIHVYHNSGEGLQHYFEYTRALKFKLGKTYLPHDAKVRELGSGKSRVGILREMGWRNTRILKRTNSVNNDIEHVRRVLPNVVLNGAEGSGCDYLVDTFHNYSKQWDDKGGCWRDKPLHDEWSNPADAFRMLVMSRYASSSSSSNSERVGKVKVRGGRKRCLAL